MRWSSLIVLILSLFFFAGTLAAPVPGLGRRDVEATSLKVRQEEDPKPGPTTTEVPPSEASTTATQKEKPKSVTDASVTDASATAEATSTGTTVLSTASTRATTTTTTNAPTTATTTTTNTAASATETVPSLDGTTASSQQEAADATRPTYSGGLPIEPKITPAWGVGGFLLIVLGAVLAFIGVRKQWVQIFLATGFLSALGVTVLIIYVMSPPVSNAVQGGYLVAVFFTGAVFGGLSLVFREICEGLGCLLGGFCLSMWFLALKSGGLLTEGGPKAGMIIAFTVGFYSLSFSHYTRPYGLIGCTSFSGATALVLGIDCYSRAGLKEFWLYIWGLNNNVFPLRTNTYPVTRGIRVELAVTIIVGVLGVISQIKLWNVIKTRRATEENSRREHDRKIEEEDAEAGRRLEEKNIQERAEWELIYGNGKAASVSETVVGDSRQGSDGFESSDNEKDAAEIKEIQISDTSGSVSDGEKNGQGENDARELETVPEESSQKEGEANHDQEPREDGQSDEKTPRPTTPVVTHVLGEGNDDSSEIGADIGSEVGTPRSKRLSGTETLNRSSWRSSNGMMVSSESRAALVAHGDANSSVLGVADDLHVMSVGCPSVASDADARDQVKEIQKETNTAEPTPAKDLTDVETKPNSVPQIVQDSAPIPDPTPAKPAVEQDVKKGAMEEKPVTQTIRKVSSVQSAILALEQNENSKTPERLKPSVKPATIRQTQVADTPKTTVEVKKKSTLEPSPMGDAKSEKMKDGNAIPTAKSVKAESIAQPKVEAIPEPRIEPKAEPKDNPKVEPKLELKTEPKAEPKVKVIKKLDASSVKFIPEQTSRVVHSYRTNEWAKHLADADTPEMEPIEFEPEPEPELSDEVHEVAAVVDVDGLLQTP
ncbi:hypothetical protein N7457_001448 [Penicillium paradoxum]|uniref:uncharacterized protein n=1 Tax=Penicillium paradoxum TaxID=176176 RepID=UPI002546A773|nr:uncharacterized protein N7457_001448 [Penicillium paradoxum]KAJ5794849.1 hypothetical protein N7457_001448 [Penicillium paradoxum]